jgi:hypothetical protein
MVRLFQELVAAALLEDSRNRGSAGRCQTELIIVLVAGAPGVDPEKAPKCSADRLLMQNLHWTIDREMVNIPENPVER